jgi:uncharacterized membrane protein
MTERELASELAKVRAAQAGLVGQLEAIDRRIKDLETQARRVEPEPVAVEPVVARQEPPKPAAAPPPLPVPSPLPVAPPAARPDPPIFVEPEPPRRETPAPPPVPRESLELRLGRVWLVRAGIVILLTGLVFLGNFAWQELVVKLGAGGKLALIYLAGAALAAGGLFLRRRSAQMLHFGNVLAGGGMAAIYYATYAAHFIEPLRVIASPLAGGVLLVALAGAILLLAVRLRLEAVAAVTTALAFYTAAINPVAGFSLFSNLLLSIVAVVLLVRQRWSSLSYISLAGCYLAFAFWRFQQTGSLFAVNVEDASLFRSALLFPACYWLVFTVAAFAARAGRLSDAGRATFLTLNNGAFYALAAPLFAGTHPEQLWWFTLLFGVLLLLLARLSARRSGEERFFDGSYLAQGLALVTLGLFLKFSGYQAALLFALQAATMMKMSRGRNGWVFQFFCGVAAVLATVMCFDAIASDLPHAALTSGAVAVVLAATAWLLKQQRGLLAVPSLEWRAASLVALAALAGLAGIFEGTSDTTTLVALVIVSVLGVFSLRVVRMPEIALAAQVFLMAALGEWIAIDDFGAFAPAAWLGAGMFMQIRWWGAQQRWVLPGWIRLVWQSLWSLVFVMVLLFWATDHFPMPAQLPVVAALGLAVVVVAVRTNCLPLLAASQLCSLITFVRFMDIVGHEGQFGRCTAALGLFVLQSAAARAWREPGQSFVFYARRGIEFLGALGAIGLAHSYLAAPALVPVLALFAFLVFFAAASLRRWSPLPSAAVLLLAAGAESLRGLADGDPVLWPALLAPLLLLLSQRIGSARLAGMDFYPRVAQVGSIVAGVLWLWLLVWKLVAANTQGFLVTMSWSVLAAVVLAAGFALRERTYRLLGLGILAASVARIFLVDVWELGTVYRILSFLVLGALLVASGFLYNRYAGAIRKLM